MSKGRTVTHKPKWEPGELRIDAAGNTKPGFICVHELENGNGQCGGNVFSLDETVGDHACIVYDKPTEADRIAAAAMRFNRTAMFHPGEGETHEDGGYPCIEIGGVQVYAYIDKLGRLRVSIDTETAEIPVRDDCTPPMIVCVNEGVVLDDSGEESLPCDADRSTIPDTYPFADQFLAECE